MSYYPESIMPSRLKDGSADVNGNKYIASASDHNKHDEEIRAIEKALGSRRPTFPGLCYSAASSGFSTATGFSSVVGFSSCTCVDGCYPAPSGCAGVTNNLMDALQNVFDRLDEIRDGMVLVTSGTVCCRNDVLGGANGLIVFPTNWPVTTLVDFVPATLPDESQPPDLDYVTLADVSGLPSIGYVSVINDSSNMLFQDVPDAQDLPDPVNVVGPTSMAQEDASFSGFSGFSGFTGFSGLYYIDDSVVASGYSSTAVPKYVLDRLVDRMANGQSTNVEVLFYAGIDAPNNRILNVRRAMLGSTATQHAPSDLVFKGRLSIQVSPTLIRSIGDDIAQIECYLRSNGSIVTRSWAFSGFSGLSSGTWYEDGNVAGPGAVAYAQYQAVLVKTLDEMPPLRPGEEPC